MVFLRYINDRTTDEEELLAIRHQFEHSEEWREHKRHHDERGERAKLVLWEEDQPAAKPEHDATFDDEPRIRHRVKVGGCECQPRLGIMQLDEDGVVPSVPQQIAEQKEQYGVVSTESSYHSLSDRSQELYNARSGGQGLYR